MDSPGLRYPAGLKIGFDELQWLQAEIAEQQAMMLVGIARETGWVGDWLGSHPDFGWAIVASGANLTTASEDAGVASPFPISRLRSRTVPYLGIGPSGEFIRIPTSDLLRDDAGDLISVPADNTWRTLVARRVLEVFEPGTITFTAGSATVTGVDTHFTRYGDSGDPRATLIRIEGSSSGNDGTYQIDSIASDTSMTLTTVAPATESAMRFRVRGQFIGTVPTEPDAHLCTRTAWELVTRTVDRQTDGLIAYDVKNNGGTISLIDRRGACVFRIRDGSQRMFTLMANLVGDPTTGEVDWLGFTNAVFQDSAAGTGHAIIATSCAPSSSGSHLTQLATDQPTGALAAVLWQDGDAGNVHNLIIEEWTAAFDDYAGVSTGVWDDPNGGGTVTVVSAAGLLDCALIALPSATGFTHVCFYVDSAGDLFCKTSADNGATWVGPATVWQPGAQDNFKGPIKKIDAVLTRGGRIIVACLLTTNLGDSVKYVRSDDWLGTWNTNTGVGHIISALTSTGKDVAICEDDRGNLWTVAGVDNDNPLVVVRGQAENDPARNATEQSAASKVGGEFSTARYESVAAFAMPGGQIGVFASRNKDAGTGEPNVLFLRINRLQVTEIRPIPANTVGLTGANTDATLPVGCTVLNNGLVMLIVGADPDATNKRALAQSQHFVPVAIERPWRWAGGV